MKLRYFDHGISNKYFNSPSWEEEYLEEIFYHEEIHWKNQWKLCNSCNFNSMLSFNKSPNNLWHFELTCLKNRIYAITFKTPPKKKTQPSVLIRFADPYSHWPDSSDSSQSRQTIKERATHSGLRSNATLSSNLSIPKLAYWRG